MNILEEGERSRPELLQPAAHPLAAPAEPAAVPVGPAESVVIAVNYVEEGRAVFGNGEDAGAVAEMVVGEQDQRSERHAKPSALMAGTASPPEGFSPVPASLLGPCIFQGGTEPPS